MQNKANLRHIQMNVSYVKTKNYEQKTMDNEPIKQSQSKPNERRELAELIKAVLRFFVEGIEDCRVGHKVSRLSIVAMRFDCSEFNSLVVCSDFSCIARVGNF